MVLQQEEFGWVLDNNKIDTERLASALPVRMRNMKGEVSYIYQDGSMAPVFPEGRLLSITDTTLFGKVKPHVFEYERSYPTTIKLFALHGLSSRSM